MNKFMVVFAVSLVGSFSFGNYGNQRFEQIVAGCAQANGHSTVSGFYVSNDLRQASLELGDMISDKPFPFIQVSDENKDMGKLHIIIGHDLAGEPEIVSADIYAKTVNCFGGTKIDREILD